MKWLVRAEARSEPEVPNDPIVEVEHSTPVGLSLDRACSQTGENLTLEHQHENDLPLRNHFSQVLNESAGRHSMAAVVQRRFVDRFLPYEKHHEQRYLDLAKNIEQGKVFKKEQKVQWKCRNCGYIHEGNEPPDKCPTCEHPRAYFELLCDHF